MSKIKMPLCGFLALGLVVTSVARQRPARVTVSLMPSVETSALTCSSVKAALVGVPLAAMIF